MEKLTEQQAKMVIEHFSQQAAEDAPEDRCTHMWMTRFQVSLAVGRRVGEWWWNSLVECQMNLQSFDRDADAWLDEHGYATTEAEKDYMREALKDQVSWSIDNAWNNSGA